MASTETGEIFTAEQYDAMTNRQRDELGIVALTPPEEIALSQMTLDERKQYLKKKKRKVRGAWHDPRYTKVTSTERQHRSKNKAERQRKKLARR